MNKLKVKFENVSKQYSLYSKQSDKLLELIFLNKKKDKKVFSALNDVSFEVNEGETIGVIGVNGSGKSTLSNLLAEIVPPSSGDIMINGQTSLIAISVGLNNGLTGLENIELKCLMHGLSKREIEEITPDISNFADIGHFINQPVKNYSSGMKSRLGFAISAFTDPDILVIDEALSVGDDTFYQKCLDKINEFKGRGKTIFFISHSLGQIKTISDKVLWLHFGQVKEFGDTKTVIENYTEFIKWFNTLSDEEKKRYKSDQLDIQLNEKKISNNSNNRYEKSKFRSYSLLLQILFFTIGTLLSAAFMFVEEPEDIYKYLTYFESGKVKETKIEAESIQTDDDKINEEESITYTNQLGLISRNDVELFYELDSSYKMGVLEFGAKVNVVEKTNDFYKITKDSQTGYIKGSDITLIDNTRNEELVLEDILFMFPESFSNAYEYYLTFIGSEYDDMAVLNSAIPSTDSDGIRNIVLDEVTYLFNEENLTETIVIDSINNSSISPLEDYFLVNTEEDDLYYLEVQGYDVILNLQNNTIKMVAVNI